MREGTAIDTANLAAEERRLFESSMARERQSRANARHARVRLLVFGLLGSALVAAMGMLLKSELTPAFDTLSDTARTCIIGFALTLLLLSVVSYFRGLFGKAVAESAADLEFSKRCPLSTEDELGESPYRKFHRQCDFQINQMRAIEHSRIVPALPNFFGAIATMAVLFRLELNSSESWVWFGAALFGTLFCFASVVSQAHRAWVLRDEWRKLRLEQRRNPPLRMAPGATLT